MEYDLGIQVIPNDVRAWADRDRIHKMGWLRAGDIIDVKNVYKNWRRFIPWSACSDLLPTDTTYPEYFVNVLDISAAGAPESTPEPVPEPEPTPIHDDDAALGRSIRILLTELKFLFNYWKGL